MLDATCPLVSKVHNQGKRYVAHGRKLILIGHAGHPEVEGTMGQVRRAGDAGAVRGRGRAAEHPDRHAGRLYHADHAFDRRHQEHHPGAERRFSPTSWDPETTDICYATQNRQTAVRELAKVADVILVVGAKNSSNSNRLVEIGKEEGLPSYLLADGSELQPEWVRGKTAVGLTAGASAPEKLVEDVIAALGRIAPVVVETMDGKKEHIEFRLPAELRKRPRTGSIRRK